MSDPARDAKAGAPAGGGFLILDKRPGVSSRRALAEAARAVGVAKAGHAGTLDPFASGVLICLLGRYTRLSDWFMAGTKGYEATVCLGSETDTLDPEGQVVATAPVPSLTRLLEAIPAFRGDILQVPPAHSAIHVDGRRAYELARKGRDVELPSRSVSIHELELIDYSDGQARLRVVCGKGTYIRSLARDLALAAGSRGYLSALRRTMVGPFGIDQAQAAEGLGPGSMRRLSEDEARRLGLAVLTLDGRSARAFSLGVPLSRVEAFDDAGQGGPAAVFGPDGLLAGIAIRDRGRWRYAMSMGGCA